jgi:hypothetical protein
VAGGGGETASRSGGGQTRATRLTPSSRCDTRYAIRDTTASEKEAVGRKISVGQARVPRPRTDCPKGLRQG